MNERQPQRAIESLPRVGWEVSKLHAKLSASYPFDRPAINGQRLGVIREQNTHPYRRTHEWCVIT